MGMEPDARDFLKRVMLSVFLGLTWLFVNMTLGIYYDLLPVYHGWPDGWNIGFYLFFAGTGVLYVWFLRRTWRR
jgi:hypothetical protein